MKFPFYDAPNTATITCCHILENGEPILYVSHDEDDGMWQFLCGKVQIPLHRITDSASNGSVFPVVTEHFSASSDHAFL